MLFRSGTSDTEILLRAIEHYGLKETLVMSRGMFALAVYDRQEKRAPLSGHPHSLSGPGELCTGQAGFSTLLSPVTCVFLGSCSF